MLMFVRSLWLFDDDLIKAMTKKAEAFLADARNPENDINPDHAVEA